MKKYRSLNERETCNIKFLSEHTYTAINNYPNLKRNDLCPCGSGKKYKRCCIDKDEILEPEKE